MKKGIPTLESNMTTPMKTVRSFHEQYAHICAETAEQREDAACRGRKRVATEMSPCIATRRRLTYWIPIPTEEAHASCVASPTTPHAVPFVSQTTDPW